MIEIHAKRRAAAAAVLLMIFLHGHAQDAPLQTVWDGDGSIGFETGDLATTVDGIYYETASGRTPVSPPPAELLNEGAEGASIVWDQTMADGRTVSGSITPDEGTTAQWSVEFTASPDDDIVGWGFAIDAEEDEYFTGLMERVVDGPQQASWAPGITEAMDLRGQRVDMLVKPTTSVYAPFYLSSRGYALLMGGTWPGVYDFAATQSDRVLIDFEGPKLQFKVYASGNPADLVMAHAMDSGPPVLPPEWIYGHWRWRDEHTQRSTYYDGTPVTGPFNSEVMEDVLMMAAYGIPNSVYWIDRPYGPGFWGYDDFEIDPERMPNFPEMVEWLGSLGQETLLWIAPFLQGNMADEGHARGYVLPGPEKPENANNYPLVDFTNPEAKQFWQDGFAKLLELGVAGYKLDRAEENIIESGPYEVFDGRSVREQRNDYPVMYVEAAYETAQELRGDDFVLMPRASYEGSTRWGVFWGGDIGGTQEGLRASIIAMQRSAVMGYPNWGSDTCGYNQQLMEQEVCGRWLAFSALSPIMEVGPTRNVAFWNTPREPEYDATLIALWRMYARLHERLRDYSHSLAEVAHETGMPIVRPLFLVEPQQPEAWSNWWTYLYGPDLLTSPVWEKGVREQQVYLPSGSRWRDAWDTDRVYDGGQTVTVRAETHQLPLFVRVGSSLDLGDLEQEWRDAQAIAATPPDIAALEQSVNEWFEENAD